MDKLKRVLFEETKYCSEQLAECKRKFGEYDFVTSAFVNRYKALMEVIIMSDSVQEYCDWRAQLIEKG